MSLTTLKLDTRRTPAVPFRRGTFAATRWTVVLMAQKSGDACQARVALNELCEMYWYPIYAYVRGRGARPEDAEDLVQGFFSRLIRLNSLSGVSQEKGRFRAFLLAGIKNYLADEWGRQSAGKRDVRMTVSWDAIEAEERYAAEPVDRLTPERLYDRRWALALLASAVRRLGEAYQAAGKGELFRHLQSFVTVDDGGVAYAELAKQLNQSEGALRVAVHRMRQCYRQYLREEIAQTVEDARDVDSELADLRRVLSDAG